MASEYTSNYNLDLYTNSDKPNLRDQYNAAMNKIDAALVADDASITTINQNIVTLSNTVNDVASDFDDMQTALETAQNDITALEGRATSLESDMVSVTAKNATQDSRLDRLESDTSDMASEITGIQADVTHAETDIEILKDDTVALDVRLDTAEASIVTLQTRSVLDWVNMANKNMVIFGDSFSDPSAANSVNEYWCKKVSGVYGLTRFNFAVGGAGFGRATNLLATQIQNASTQMTEDEKNNTALVFCYMGYNDIVNSVATADIESGFTNLCTRCSAIFPNAKLIVIPFNWGYGLLTTAYLNTIITEINNFRSIAATNCTIPYCIVDDARYWIMGQHGMFQNAVHPNASGYNVVASNIMDILNGCHTPVKRYFSIGTASGGTTFNNQGIFHDGMITLNFGWYGSQAVTNYNIQFPDHIPDIAIPTHETCMRLSANGLGSDGILRINDQGVLTGIATTDVGGTYRMLNGSITYPAACNATW